MTSAVPMSVAQYLSTSYRPDCDYIDGEVQERNLGDQWHAAVQINLGIIFGQHRHEWGLRPLTEQRVRVSASRIRIPDVCLVPMNEPFIGVLRKPPVLCIEVLSPKDRIRLTQDRAEDYFRMGVTAVWIVNPRSRDIWTMVQAGLPVLHEEDALTLSGTPVHIPVSDILALIDEAPDGEED